jgi:phosphohistidine swiveling domain-containing protein
MMEFPKLGPPPGGLGGKSESWWRVTASGLPAPAGFAVPADADLADLDVALARLRASGVGRVAVRSSGIGEDGHHQAYAGLFETYLDVPADPSEVRVAIERCRAAGGTARTRSAVGGTIAMGVLVQEMIRPEFSGVLFTRDPLGQRDAVVVEAVEGHLRGLVDGTADAARFHLSADATTTPWPALDGPALLELARAIEATMGWPADVEWASTGGRLVILQARPITSGDVRTSQGLTLVAVSADHAAQLPHEVVSHDKLALRLLAAQLRIPISHGFVGLAARPDLADVDAAAQSLTGWGEFIAVLLHPFDLDGEIFRRFGTGATAADDLRAFVTTIAKRHPTFAFLLKELQETAATGVAVRRPDGTVHVEVIHGHFITKGFADPTIYELAADGSLALHTPGRQDVAMQVALGKKVRVPIDAPIEISAAQLAAVFHATSSLSNRYPTAGVEFGFDTAGNFFLVDLYQSAAAAPPDRADVLSAGRVVGRVRILDLPEETLEASIERHVHSRRSEAHEQREPEILVVRRPLHVLDQLVYGAAPDTLGFICEGGALLCHLAVVMRERGVPGLVLPGAMSTLADGDRIVLDTRPGSRAAITRT